jgi:hypothetical protein
MREALTILFLGNRFEGSTSRQRLRAFEDLGHRVLLLPTGDGFRKPGLWRRVRHRLRIPREFDRENARLLELVRAERPDLVWIEKGLTIHPATLRRARKLRPGCRLVSYSADDMMNPRNQSRYWRRSVALYDVHVTTKTHNIDELYAAGARRVVFTPKSYDPHTHRPLALSEADRVAFGARVGFIGSWEAERARSIRFLGEHGIPVRVWGAGWDRLGPPPPAVRIENRGLYGMEYAMGINGTDINLCFLRKSNRDRQTARSIEIPACGAFMLAERTDEHLELFREGEEADFFASDRELLDKIRYYLEHDDERRRIARAGRRRCLRSGYDHAARLRLALAEILAPKTGKEA